MEVAIVRRLASPIPFFAKCSTASASRLSRLTDLLELGRLGGDVVLGEFGVEPSEQPAEWALLDDRRGRDRALRRTDHAVATGRLDAGSLRDPFEVFAFLELGHLPDGHRELGLA